MKKNQSTRRATSLGRLKTQLEDNIKTNKGETYPLTDKDKKRINKEIGILTSLLIGE